MDGELRVIGRGIHVVVAILIVEIIDVSEFPARIDPPFQTLPAAGGGSGRQNVRMLAVIPQIGPAGQSHIQSVNTAGL
jgi:hypothetical protein